MVSGVSMADGASEQTTVDRGDVVCLRLRALDEAAALFSALGYSGTSMRAVAERLGCTKPALYYHFAGKEALFAESVAFAAEELHDRARASLVIEGPAQTVLKASVRGLFCYVRTFPHRLRLLHYASRSPEGRANHASFDFVGFRTELLGAVRQVLLRGQQSGEVDRNLSLDDAAMALTGMVDQRLLLFLFEGEPIDDDVGERIVDMLFRGIAAEADIGRTVSTEATTEGRRATSEERERECER